MTSDCVGGCVHLHQCGTQFLIVPRTSFMDTPPTRVVWNATRHVFAARCWDLLLLHEDAGTTNRNLDE